LSHVLPRGKWGRGKSDPSIIERQDGFAGLRKRKRKSKGENRNKR
jgi:hypothetical protein